MFPNVFIRLDTILTWDSLFYSLPQIIEALVEFDDLFAEFEFR